MWKALMKRLAGFNPVNEFVLASDCAEFRDQLSLRYPAENLPARACIAT